MQPSQRKIHSDCNAYSTLSEVMRDVDLTGKRAIVTGGYSGIGLELVKALSSAGAHVLVPARRVTEATVLLGHINNVEIAELDLMQPDSIDAFAKIVLSKGAPLHLLLNVAGIMAAPLSRDRRGYESQFAVNHLGHFHLTLRVWPSLVLASGARVISVSSRGHRIAPVDIDDPNFERRTYDRWVAYGQSKTANSLFAVALDARGIAHGVRAFSVHPGSVLTPLSRHLSDDDLRQFGVSRDDPGGVPAGQSIRDGGDFRSIEQAAGSVAWCAVSPRLEGHGGLYCENANIAERVPSNSPVGEGVADWAVDTIRAEALWALSERMTGLRGV
jgi:NAD(P)-dependent dehydrogenase (short-subunit alcohol dehydrogenase family)